MGKVVNVIACFCAVYSFAWIAIFENGGVLHLNKQAQLDQLAQTENAIVQAKELAGSETVWVVRSRSILNSHISLNLETEGPYYDERRAVTLEFRSNLQPSAEQFEELVYKDRLKLKFVWRPTLDPTNPTSYLDPERLSLIPPTEQ